MIVVAITSMVLSIGLVMCALASGELIFQLAFWGAALAILIGAAFLLAVVSGAVEHGRISTIPGLRNQKTKARPRPGTRTGTRSLHLKHGAESGKVKAAKKGTAEGTRPIRRRNAQEVKEDEEAR